MGSEKYIADDEVFVGGLFDNKFFYGWMVQSKRNDDVWGGECIFEYQEFFLSFLGVLLL
ncbi:MAG: hypothetical protein Fur0023_22020 [Bacteroidia bacterium]